MRRMAIDVGNTHIKLGVHSPSEGWIGEWRLSTDVRRTADEYRVTISILLADLGLQHVDQMVLASVVPLLTPALIRVGEIIGRLAPLEVRSPGYGMRVRYEPPEALGADRFVNALSAWHRVRRSVVILDAGTTATVDAVNDQGEFIGGTIAPGPHFLADALAQGTAKLLHIPPTIPNLLVGTSTETAIQVGVGHGFVGMVEALVERAWQALGGQAPVVLTGGWASRIQPYLKFSSTHDPRLTLEGLIVAADYAQGEQ